MPQPHRRSLLMALLGGSFCNLIPAQAWAQHPSGQAAQQAMFNTKAEAEAAAPRFHCSGAHPMGNQWMPCASHGAASGGHGTATPMGH